MKRKPGQKTKPGWRPHLTHFLPYIVLTAATVVFFWEIISRQYFLWEDILYQYYPFNYFLFKNLRHFTLPVWNPYMFAGMPFLADIQTQVFYPLSWLLAFISNSSQSYVFWLVELKAIVHLLLGAIGFYLLMRELKLSYYSGIIAGITFAFSGFMVTHIIHLTLVSTFAWFPLVLMFFYRTLREQRLRDATATALCLGLANLAGHPQMTLHIVYALILLFILHIIFNWHTAQRLLFKKHLPLLILTIILGFAISAAAYIPSYRYSLHTVREMMTFAESAGTSLPLWFLITIFVPKFFGSIAGGTVETVPFWIDPAPYTYWETCLYVGVISIVLAFIGLISGNNNRRWQFGILALIALLLALGRFTPIYRIAFEILPGINRFRIPARFVNLFITAIAFLAGLGMETILHHDIKKDRRIFAPILSCVAYALLILFALLSGILLKPFPALKDALVFTSSLNQTLIMLAFIIIGTALIILTLRYPKRKHLLASLIIALAFFDLYQFGHRFSLGTVAPEQFYPPRPFINRLIEEQKTEPFRINARTGSNMILQRNEGLLWELELLEGYTPLKLIDYITFEIPVDRRNDLLNVKYRIQIDSLRGTIGLVPNPTLLPRFWLADSWIVVPDRTEILKTLSDPEFDYRRVVILEKEPLIEQKDLADSILTEEVKLVKRTPERIELEVQNSRPALLVLSEIYYPEWRATVDGKPVEILRADYCLRALPLSPGIHRVITYHDRTWINLGILISALASLATILILTVPLSRGKLTHRK